MAIVQLNPPLYMVTPLGPGWRHFVWENGSDNDVQWCCFIEKTGEPWWWVNNMVRLATNLTGGRTATSPIHETSELKAALESHRARNSRASVRRRRC